MNQVDPVRIGDRRVGPGCPAYVVAEMSGNHNREFSAAVEIVHAAKEAGADAVKLQTYTPDTLTIDCDAASFLIPAGNTWQNRTLYDLYSEAYTPWEWQPKLKEEADAIGIDLFSAAFDTTSVDFLEEMGVEVYKVASFELTDHQLVRRIAATGKPMIMSTGLATLEEIDEAVRAARMGGCSELILLECTSSYPSSPADANLRNIPHLAERFDVPTGISDHTLGIAVSIAAISVGACVVEKHFKLEGSSGGPDTSFSITPTELRELVDNIRSVESALGNVDYQISESEAANRCFRRSLFVVEDTPAGATFTDQNVRSIRPGYGLPPKHLEDILGRRACRDVKRGEPMQWDMIQDHEGG